MYFYNVEGTMIVKYEVQLDYRKLKELKKQIIDNCSLIEHKKEESTTAIIYFNSGYIKNYKSEKTNKKDFKTKRNIYSVSYDVYEPPYLVYLINELLKENTSVITEILNYEEIFDVEESKIKNKYDELLKKIYNPDYVKIYKNPVPEQEDKSRIDSLRELEKLLTDYQKEKEENNKKTNIEKYRMDVLNCIFLKEIQKLPIEYLSFVQNFFSESTEKTLDKTLKKILTKPLINNKKEEF